MTKCIQSDWSHLHFRTYDQWLLGPLGCPQLSPLWYKKLSNSPWLTSLDNSKLFTYKPNLRYKSRGGKPAHHLLCSRWLHATIRGWLSPHHRLPTIPYANILLILPQEWSVFNVILPFRNSKLFNCCLYYYQVHCFHLGSFHPWSYSQAHFNLLFKTLVKYHRKQSSFSPLLRSLQLRSLAKSLYL